MIELDFKKKLNFADTASGFLEIKTRISEGDFVVLFGKSGVGKTSFLKVVAGLLDPDEGKIILKNKTWFSKLEKTNISPQKRNIGFVFQDYALFPNMTVKENISFAQPNPDNIFLNELIELLGLQGLLNRKPDSLSGGQKQRTALARAVARKPSILLLDEPLSALDQETRLNLQNELALIHKNYKLTTLMVSHDIAEIAKLANKVIVLEGGKIREEGDPLTIFSKGKVSGKVKIIGEVLEIAKEDVIFVLTIVTGSNIIKVVATESDVKDLRIGDKVLIASKAFNPIIMKI